MSSRREKSRPIFDKPMHAHRPEKEELRLVRTPNLTLSPHIHTLSQLKENHLSDIDIYISIDIHIYILRQFYHDRMFLSFLGCIASDISSFSSSQKIQKKEREIINEKRGENAGGEEEIRCCCCCRLTSEAVNHLLDSAEGWTDSSREMNKKLRRALGVGSLMYCQQTFLQHNEETETYYYDVKHTEA